jgi:hypothetical protein
MEPFSTTDVYYVNAGKDETGQESQLNKNERLYKENVDKLIQLQSSYGLTQKQNTDLNTGQNSLILNNVTLGIGIFAMMLMITNMSKTT